jgi:hypothetical protein
VLEDSVRRSNRKASTLVRLLIPVFLGAAALTACSDRQPVAPREPSAPPPLATRALSVFDCTASIHGTLNCDPVSGSAGQASGVLIGGQNVFVKLTSSNVSYDAGTEIFQFDVTVKNLMNEAIGTADGIVADPDGIQVFFHHLGVTSGTGAISVANADGTATFTSGNQPYFAYHEILARNAVSSARTWQLSMPPTVETFGFTLFVETDVQYLLVINEVMANPGGTITDASGEWFEIFNAGTREVQMQNLVIADSAAGGRRPYHRISSSLVVQPGGYVVLGNTANTTSNGGVPVNYAYGSALALANGVDALKISRVYGPDTLTIDRAAYVSASISAKNGISRELTNPALDNANIDGSNWADADAAAVYGPGGRGTPGAQNSTATGSIPLCTQPSMAVGDVRVVNMPGGYFFCLDGGASGAEYTVVPLNTSASADAPLSLTATGIVPVSGSPNLAPTFGASTIPVSGLSSLRAADAFELRLRQRERRELTRLIPATRRNFRTKTPEEGARRSISQGTPATNDLMALNVESTGSCASANMRTGRVEVVGTHVIVVADTSNPAGGLGSADYQEIADRFDTLVWPTLTASFGAPEDIDLNGRVVVFVTRAVNALTPNGAAPVTHGFTLRRDLFFSSSCAGSNEGEMIYLEAADPAGTVNGNARSATSVKAAAALTLGHEMAHLVNASRRLYVNFAPAFEETWLDEGLAGVAEELLFHAASGKQPRQNLVFADVTDGGAAQAAFTAYAEPNYARLRQWLLAPQASGLFQGDNDLATRGAAWAFLRYAADRKGGTESAFWSALVNSTSTGMTSVQAAIGTDPNAWVLDFAAATYSDDGAAGGAGAYMQPSWNFRSFYNALDYNSDQVADDYPLATRNPFADVPDTFTLATGGGAAYLRMGVAANATGIVSIRSGGAAPPSTVRVAIIRQN